MKCLDVGGGGHVTLLMRHSSAHGRRRQPLGASLSL